MTTIYANTQQFLSPESNSSMYVSTSNHRNNGNRNNWTKKGNEKNESTNATPTVVTNLLILFSYEKPDWRDRLP